LIIGHGNVPFLPMPFLIVAATIMVKDIGEPDMVLVSAINIENENCLTVRMTGARGQEAVF
jgi:hypothetical protein